MPDLCIDICDKTPLLIIRILINSPCNELFTFDVGTFFIDVKQTKIKTTTKITQ